MPYLRKLDIDITPAAERRLKLWTNHYWGEEERVRQDMAQFNRHEFWLNYSRLLLDTVEVNFNIHARAQQVREWFYYDYKPQVALASGSYKVLQTPVKLVAGSQTRPSSGTLSASLAMSGQMIACTWVITIMPTVVALRQPA